jgi:hypothetical protein
MTRNDLTTARRPADDGDRLHWLSPALLMVIACGGGPDGTAPEVAGTAMPDPQVPAERAINGNPGGGKGSGKPDSESTSRTIPTPPGDGAPWKSPATKLPRSLVEATALLFESGVADPRGCDYREIEVEEQGFDGMERRKARGFVLPGRAGEAGLFAVGWDGVVRRVLAVGAKADLEADVGALAVVLRKSRESPRLGGYLSVNVDGVRTDHRFPISPFDDDRQPAPAVPRPTFTLAMLLRLGRADLAESLYAAATTWTPETARPDLADEHLGFPSLSIAWADTAYSGLIRAHRRGVDAEALDAARRLDRFRKAVKAKAVAPVLERNAPRRGPDQRPVYVRNAKIITELLADQERRAPEGPRVPVPPRGGDPAAHVAALIRDFDQINVTRLDNRFALVDPGEDSIFRALVAEGDAAVGPLLAALESDTRLTRSITGPGEFGIHPLDGFRTHPVVEIAYAALQRLLQTDHFLPNGADYGHIETPDGRTRLAATARAWWEKNPAMPLVDRCYRTLLDDSAGTDRWLEAAEELGRPPGGWARYRPGLPQPKAMIGDPLRKLRNPSISEVLARRCRELAETGEDQTIRESRLYNACLLADRFVRWDEAGSLSTLKALMNACRRLLEPGQANNPSIQFYEHMAKFTLVRAQAGDRVALGEYAAWIPAIHPETIDHHWEDILNPLWTYPDDRALAAAARAMFLDPKSPWLPLIPVEKYADRRRPYTKLIASPLACVPVFREALIAALADRTKVGTAVRRPTGLVHYELAMGEHGAHNDPPDPGAVERPGTAVPIRTCDYVAWKLQTLEGAPECLLTWSEARRDRAIAASAEYLRRYGPHLAAEYPPDDPDHWHQIARLRFPILDHPATPDDVREGRAAFSAAGEGEARVVKLPSGYPVHARWLALADLRLDSSRRAGPPGFGSLQDGWVWQGEEVLKGGRWERSYGFVGHATIARVAASEIKFSPDSSRRQDPPSGFAARIEPVGATVSVFRPGQPIIVELRLYNARGTEGSAPTEFLRAAADGKPALRRGVTVTVSEIPSRNDERPEAVLAPTTREPSRTEHFDPGPAARLLGPTESFAAMRIDVNDWYAGLPPGSYFLELTFEAVSGIGKGSTNWVSFGIGDPDRRGP